MIKMKPMFVYLSLSHTLISCRFNLPQGAPPSPDGAFSAFAQQAYVKASNTAAGDVFGDSVALSADGSTLAVGAWGEDSITTGIDGNQADNSAERAGAVYVFVRDATTWRQQAYIKASNSGGNDCFGRSIGLSADGSTLVVGAYAESSSATGINGDQADNAATYAGAAYVFTRSNTTWSQQAYIKPSNTGAGDFFGRKVALSADGATLAVSAYIEDGAATGINGNQADNSARDAGAVYIFTRAGAIWGQQAYIKASNTGAYDYFGFPMALSNDGSTLAVGAVNEDSADTGIDGNQPNNSAADSGAVYVFRRFGAVWAQQAYIKASNTGAQDRFGSSIALSADGTTMAVGADQEDSAAVGLAGNQADNSAENAGAMYVFKRIDAIWTQQAYIKASNAGAGDNFGSEVALSADGMILAVGARSEASAATGVNGDQSDNSAAGAGAVYLFSYNDAAWDQEAYIKASNTGPADLFGFSIALSSDGLTLAVGTGAEDSLGTGVDGNQAGDFDLNTGAVYVFH